MLRYTYNVEPRVSPHLFQRLVAGRNSGIMDFLVNFVNFLIGCSYKSLLLESHDLWDRKSHYPRASPGDQPQTKSWRNSGLEIGIHYSWVMMFLIRLFSMKLRLLTRAWRVEANHGSNCRCVVKEKNKVQLRIWEDIDTQQTSVESLKLWVQPQRWHFYSSLIWSMNM